MSWQKRTGLAHRARTAAETWAVVRPVGDDEDVDGRVVWETDGGAVAIDVPEDLATAVAPAVAVTIDYGVELTVWRDDRGAVHDRGSRGGVSGGDRLDDEAALWALVDALGDAAAPRACFFLPVVGRRAVHRLGAPRLLRRREGGVRPRRDDRDRAADQVGHHAGVWLGRRVALVRRLRGPPDRATGIAAARGRADDPGSRAVRPAGCRPRRSTATTSRRVSRACARTRP
jgi:hypothetical protein